MLNQRFETGNTINTISLQRINIIFNFIDKVLKHWTSVLYTVCKQCTRKQKKKEAQTVLHSKQLTDSEEHSILITTDWHTIKNHCRQCNNPSVNLLLPPLSFEQDPEILKLLKVQGKNSFRTYSKHSTLFPLRTVASDLELLTFIPVSSNSGITFHSERRRSPPDEARRTILPIKDRDKILKAPHTASHAPINSVYKNDDQIQWKVTAQADPSTHWE